MGLKACLCVVAVFCIYLAGSGVNGESDARDDRTIDQVIQDAMDMSPHLATATATEQDELLNNTVLVELDMRYPKEEYELIKQERENGNRLSTRAALRDELRRWTNKVVPYSFAAGHYSDEEKKVFEGVFEEYQRRTCLTFKPKTSEKKSITFYHSRGCWSYVGMHMENQPISLGNGCKSHGTILHELGHALGLEHEQCRPDRDQYVSVHTENVDPAFVSNFRKSSTSDVSPYGTEYDYGSVMHYGKDAFSNNGKTTIATKDKNWETLIGKRGSVTLSFGDLKLLNTAYKCADHCGAKTCPNGGYMDKHCNCQCKGCPVKSCDGPGPFENLSCVCKDKAKGKGITEHGCDYKVREWGCDDYWSKNDCPIRCGICTPESGSNGGETDCEDLAADCSSKEEKGYCSTKFNCMNRKCKKTCGLC